MTKEEKLYKKLVDMKVFEEELYSKGINYIAGVDEVGRGPLAGPVVAAAVILPKDFHVLGIDDSKKLSEKKRELLYDQIIDNSICYGIGIIDNLIIDEINILEATKIAMKDAIEQVNSKINKIYTLSIEHILIDALTLKDMSIAQTGIIKGDTKSVSIAAASILAKVTRDRMMQEYHKEFPYYAFDKNKGYGTKAHYKGLDEFGICKLHRMTFLKKYLRKSL
ncbi:ribonuclease HII [Anaerovorax odorimutans]|uniref:ribonuclease HII n=1 Tax=Anaerovorax odorimutans TaxID=109327 RepID=UPI0004008D6D|nr:ribonuclease HII [Anaerovorax odorimutans]